MGTVWQPRLVYDVQQLSSAPAAADKLPLNGLSLSKAIQERELMSAGVASGCKTLASFFSRRGALPTFASFGTVDRL